MNPRDLSSSGMSRRPCRMQESTESHSMKRRRRSLTQIQSMYLTRTYSQDEDRSVKLGRSRIGRLLVVVYTQRDQRIRIISARRANRREREQYEERF